MGHVAAVFVTEFFSSPRSWFLQTFTLLTFWIGNSRPRHGFLFVRDKTTVNAGDQIRADSSSSFIPGMLYSLMLAFPSWAGILAITYTMFLFGFRSFLFRDLR